MGFSTRPLFKSALKLFLSIGAGGTALMICLSPILSSLQGEPLIKGYLALAPSVFLTSAIAVFRGYFQAERDMRPTALSEVVEQVVKVSLGLLFAYLNRGNPVRAVGFLLLAVSVSELTALGVLILLYGRAKNREKSIKDGGRVALKSVFAVSFPASLSSSLFPLSSFLDSVVLVRLMEKYTQNAVSLYGLFSGGAASLAALPASVCHALAVSCVPEVSKAHASGQGKESVKKVLLWTAAFSFVGSLGLYLLAPQAVQILFKGLTAEERLLTARLVRGLSIGTVFLACSQTLSSCLTAMKKPKYSVYAAALAVGVKLLLNFLLVSKPEFSIFGGVIALDVCYFVDFLLNLLYNLRVVGDKNNGDRQKEQKNDYGSRTWRRIRRFNRAWGKGD
ncbi:MAG: polysaccharide biosynthesis C-terminal domain-containing protein, partial [Clostridia bacterium]|nr:polysaccharide biosynthesis C-terminal domain-containing protein [Clostridia bacterium]